MMNKLSLCTNFQRKRISKLTYREAVTELSQIKLIVLIPFAVVEELRHAGFVGQFAYLFKLNRTEIAILIKIQESKHPVDWFTTMTSNFLNIKKNNKQIKDST